MARPAELPALDDLSVGELAFALGITWRTVIRRLHLWERDPRHPRGIRYRRKLGRPYRIPRSEYVRITSLEDAA